MYLTDKEIFEKLNDLNIECSNPKEPFRPEEQIQPCSIDLRLDNVFWIPKKAGTIDLRKSKLLELSPRRYWKKVVLKKGEYLTLKPGELILGRIYEKFTIPPNCAGKIEGRSSFARMGLGVHISGDFINPGYRGHMPLQLVNYNPNPIKLYPYIPICQLMLIRLSGRPERLYGERELQSKYIDDDGGPSYWWRDKRIRRLQDRLKEFDIILRIQEEILEKIGAQEPEVIERFEKFITKLSIDEFENVEYILEKFLEHEEKLRKRGKLLKNTSLYMFPIFASASLAALFVKPVCFYHWILWGVSGIFLFPFIYYLFFHEPQEYLNKQMLEERKNV